MFFPIKKKLLVFLSRHNTTFKPLNVCKTLKPDPLNNKAIVLKKITKYLKKKKKLGKKIPSFTT